MRRLRMFGLLVINKPLGWTSMDVIRRVRRLTNIKKVGHAGTLDPLATGVLLVCVGREATRHIDKLMGLEKEYITTIDLSAFSNTDDAEGEKVAVEVINQPTTSEINAVLQQFIGTIEQVPPHYSAIKVNGKRAYKLARQNKEFELSARPVTIHSIETIKYTWPLLTLKIHCGKGTYIRSLGRDIGTALKTGGYLTQLERTAIGPYTLDKAIDIQELQETPTSFYKTIA